MFCDVLSDWFVRFARAIGLPSSAVALWLVILARLLFIGYPIAYWLSHVLLYDSHAQTTSEWYK